MSLGATDKQRSLFLKGFKLSKQGNYEDPTYLGFKVIIDFGVLPVNADDGLPPSPLFKDGNYYADNFTSRNPFGQSQYNYMTESRDGRVAFYSAAGYLEQRESDFQYGGKRADMLRQFKTGFNDLLTNSPWFLQSISGLDALAKIARPGYQNEASGGAFSSQRTAGKSLTFSTLESLNLRVSSLADLYNYATFDADNMRELLPRNLRKFTMYIFVSEIRNFFKTSRLIGSSAALTAIDNVATLLGSGNNPGSNLGVASSVSAEQNQNFNSGGSSLNPASSFNSFVGNVLNGAGLDNDFSLLKNQEDQSGIKPMIVFECKNCEFDFTDSTPIKNIITPGTETATAETQKFVIHVGKVRMRSQYPNIRSDGKPLILGDSWDGARSSVQKNPRDTRDILSLGGELLTNFVSNSLNDLINEGVANFAKNNLAGLDKAIMGNAYSFNPSELLSNLSFNSAQDFLNGFGNANLGFAKSSLPNPQTMGQGGPPERVYSPVSGDVYPTSPGGDLGVPTRVYAAPGGDEYPTSPGGDLGVPTRVYAAPVGDEYPTSPGADLGVPARAYPAPGGDEYPTSPGADLGVPARAYPAPTGDEYTTSPGVDLGVPARAYPAPTGDEYTTSPGVDLGVPARAYPAPGGDEYPTNPGADLGVPTRAYAAPTGDEYPTSPGSDLGVPARAYPAPIGDEYPTNPGADLGVPGRAYPPSFGDEYANSPGSDLGLPTRSYPDPSGPSVYPETNLVNVNGELRDASNTFAIPPQPVYPSAINRGTSRGDIGKVYPPTSGDFQIDKPLDLGNLKPETRYNISTGRFNTPETEFE
jgi:hypothetical protein